MRNLILAAPSYFTSDVCPPRKIKALLASQVTYDDVILNDVI